MCFEARGFILRETVAYTVWYVLHVSVRAVWWIGGCVPADQTAHADARKSYRTAYTTVSLRVNR
jgi:hypothetical protein